MYRRIVVPLDGSEVAELALPEAERMARLTGAPLHLVRVIDVTQLPWYGMFAVNMDQLTYESALGDETKQATDYLASVAKRFIDDGMAVTHAVPQGRTVPQLVAVAQPGDLVVMASHGRGGISRWFLGSVAEDVLRHATVPVLLIKAGIAEPTMTDAELVDANARFASGTVPTREPVVAG